MMPQTNYRGQKIKFGGDSHCEHLPIVLVSISSVALLMSCHKMCLARRCTQSCLGNISFVTRKITLFEGTNGAYR